VPFDLPVNELRIESAWLNPLTHQRMAGMSRRVRWSWTGRSAARSDLIGAAPAPEEIKLIAVP